MCDSNQLWKMARSTEKVTRTLVWFHLLGKFRQKKIWKSFKKTGYCWGEQSYFHSHWKNSEWRLWNVPIDDVSWRSWRMELGRYKQRRWRHWYILDTLNNNTTSYIDHLLFDSFDLLPNNWRTEKNCPWKVLDQFFHQFFNQLFGCNFSVAVH